MSPKASTVVLAGTPSELCKCCGSLRKDKIKWSEATPSSFLKATVRLRMSSVGSHITVSFLGRCKNAYDSEWTWLGLLAYDFVFYEAKR